MKGTRFTTEQLASLGFTIVDGKAVRPATPAPVPPPPAPKAQIRLPKPLTPNKTEADALQHIERTWPGAEMRFASFTFRLPAGTKYTPDWTVWNGPTILACYEIKGPHIHNARSLEAFKAARAAFPAHTWIFLQKLDGQWCEAQ